MSADFLLELRSEEIPARMQAGARADLERLFRKALENAGLTPGPISVWSTPRRLALIARDLPLATGAVSEEVKGPRTSAPPQALEGFLRKTGLTADQLTDRDGIWFAVLEKPGRATTEVLAEAIPALIRAFPWPKSQRWGADSLSSESLRWVRPLSGIIALLGGEVIPCEIGGVVSGRETMGHRFHHTGAITIDGADDYASKLRAAHVIVDEYEREKIVLRDVRLAAAEAGLKLVEDENLVVENAGLTEWPVPLLGRFDEVFLSLPPEVIQLTTRINQKYFVTQNPPRTGEGDRAKRGGGALPQAQTLANAFICTANIAATDGGAAIIAGNGKVLAARLADARFFWDQDQKTSLEEQAKKLVRITFHEKLGSLADKVDRVASLAERLASEGVVPGADPAKARQAAELCKADLVTEMVGEFPELQGIMGGYYARVEGLGDLVADAIRDHYKPVGQSDDVPNAPVTLCVALADKLDTLVSFFAVGLAPTGSKDPFALRRAALGVIRLIQINRLRLPLRKLFDRLQHELDSDTKAGLEQTLGINFATNGLLAFFADRLKVLQREWGIRHDLIDAVFALDDEDDLVRMLDRATALQRFVESTDGVNLLAGYKRAANILKKETWQPEPPNYTPEPAEAALRAALGKAVPLVTSSIAAEDFTAAMAALASLRAPIDAFFVSVTVNDADANKRANRLALLDEFRAAVHKVADFSRIEG